MPVEITEAPEPYKSGKYWVVKFVTEMGSTMTFTCNTRDACLAIIDTMVARPSPPCDSRTEALEAAVTALDDAADILARLDCPNTAQRCQRASESLRALSEAGRSALKQEGEYPAHDGETR